MSIWEEYDFENRLRDILKKEVPKPNSDHHFGNQFLSGYQLAIEYDKSYHDDVLKMGMEIGGKGSHVTKPLARYIANELSRKISDGSIKDIEGGFFSNTDLNNLVFNHNGQQITSSLINSESAMAIFRYKGTANTNL